MPIKYFTCWYINWRPIAPILPSTLRASYLSRRKGLPNNPFWGTPALPYFSIKNSYYHQMVDQNQFLILCLYTSKGFALFRRFFGWWEELFQISNSLSTFTRNHKIFLGSKNNCLWTKEIWRKGSLVNGYWKIALNIQ